MIDYAPLLAELSGSKLENWAKILPQQIAEGLCPQRHGEVPTWLAELEKLPAIRPSSIDLKQGVRIGSASDLSEPLARQLESSLHALLPWRKGPFSLFGIEIDTEWRSDWKWNRLLPHISPLRDRLVIDVGCGNGYHVLRMLGEGAARVIGIDPSPRFIAQFYLLKHFLNLHAGDVAADILPVGIQDVPESLQAFDTCFSMGVLYHRRSPMDHLKQLLGLLKPGGELVLETLIVEGEAGYSLVPRERYAKMNNVWFIPSPATLIEWLLKCGFDQPRCVDINQTSLDEQRATPWISGQSLADFLDPNDRQRTVEGYPAPRRGIFIAHKKV